MLLSLDAIVPFAAKLLEADLAKLRADPAAVGRTYKKALLRLHPDKLRNVVDVDTRGRMLATAVFEQLQIAYGREK